MLELASLPLALVVFAVCAAVIAVVGTHLTALADVLADRTRLGEALFGAIFLGATTSLSGTVTSITAAVERVPDLAFANAVGGIPAQTAFLVVADLVYRRANLEHAAASIGSLFASGLLVLLLALPLAAALVDEVSLFGVHPVSVVLLAAYAYGLRLMRGGLAGEMWTPRRTSETRTDEPRPAGGGSLAGLSVRFAVAAAIVGGAGWALAGAGTTIAAATGLSTTVVGALLTAVATSLPELVTTIAAVRRGALTLAVAGIIGGNTFDVVILSVADVGYRPGSLYHAVLAADLFLLVLAILVTSIALLGLLSRQRRGVATIGFEGVAILAVYALGVAALVAAGS